MGYIYILGSSKSALHKIGYSDNPQIRITALKANVSDAKPVRIFFGTMADERALHEKFAKNRVSGEWFRLSGKDIELICKYFSDYEQQTLMLSQMCAAIIEVNIDRFVPAQYKPKASMVRESSNILLTESEYKKARSYKISERTAKLVKSILIKNEDASIRDVCSEIGCSVSLASKALSCFRSHS